MRKAMFLILLLLLAVATGCPSSTPSGGGGEVPSFNLAWSEYPSWSVFGVADENGIIDKEKGKLGPVEEKWNVDIVLSQQDYEPCIQLYGSATVDAVCITNMDILAPSLGRDSVAILPTSTSDGADACIVVGVESVDALAGKSSYGLEKTVSQYMFERNLEILGKNAADFPFKNMDPGAAAQAMQTDQENIDSIVVWNPFVLQTLSDRTDARVLFDSTTIPEEIIDMVVVGKDVLQKPGGDKFACAVIETFYEVNKLLADPQKGDDTLVALGAKFSSLPLEKMKKVVEQTKFYKTTADALALYEGQKFQTDTMPKVVDFCVSHDIVESPPQVGFGDKDAQLNFDTTYLKMVQEQ